MPVMDGYTATSLIRQQPRFATLPVIAMTANAMSGDRERALVCGMNDHIAKPLDVASMFATLAKWIKPRARQPVVASVAAPEAVSPTGSLPTGLDGIDQAAGLATCQGKAELYQRLLRKFHAANQGFAAQFAAALADPDATAATRLAHSLKGTAGNIGAFEVAQAAAALELCCQSSARGEQLQTALNRVEQSLAPVLAALAVLDAGTLEPAPSVALPDADIQPRLARLGQLLAESDSEALEVLVELQTLSLQPELAGRLAKVAQQVERFEFDAALAALLK